MRCSYPKYPSLIFQSSPTLCIPRALSQKPSCCLLDADQNFWRCWFLNLIPLLRAFRLFGCLFSHTSHQIFAHHDRDLTEIVLHVSFEECGYSVPHRLIECCFFSRDHRNKCRIVHCLSCITVYLRMNTIAKFRQEGSVSCFKRGDSVRLILKPWFEAFDDILQQLSNLAWVLLVKCGYRCHWVAWKDSV